MSMMQILPMMPIMQKMPIMAMMMTILVPVVIDGVGGGR